jgi:hypothetical protein
MVFATVISFWSFSVAAILRLDVVSVSLDDGGYGYNKDNDIGLSLQSNS